MTAPLRAVLLSLVAASWSCGPTTPPPQLDAFASVRPDAYAFVHVDLVRARASTVFDGLDAAAPALAEALDGRCVGGSALRTVTISVASGGARVALVGRAPRGCAVGLGVALGLAGFEAATVHARGASTVAELGPVGMPLGLADRVRPHVDGEAVALAAARLDAVPDQDALREALGVPARLHTRFVDGAVAVASLQAAPDEMELVLDLADDERAAIAEQTLLGRADAYAAVAAGLVDEALRDPSTPDRTALPAHRGARRPRGTPAEAAELVAALLALRPTRDGPAFSLAVRLDGARSAPARALVDAAAVSAVRAAYTEAAIREVTRLADALDAYARAAAPGARRFPRPLPPIPPTPRGLEVSVPPDDAYVAGWLDLGYRLSRGSPYAIGADVGTTDYVVHARADFDEDGDASELRIEGAWVDGRVVRQPLGHGNPGE